MLFEVELVEVLAFVEAADDELLAELDELAEVDDELAAAELDELAAAALEELVARFLWYVCC